MVAESPRTSHNLAKIPILRARQRVRQIRRLSPISVRQSPLRREHRDQKGNGLLILRMFVVVSEHGIIRHVPVRLHIPRLEQYRYAHDHNCAFLYLCRYLLSPPFSASHTSYSCSLVAIKIILLHGLTRVITHVSTRHRGIRTFPYSQRIGWHGSGLTWAYPPRCLQRTRTSHTPLIVRVIRPGYHLQPTGHYTRRPGQRVHSRVKTQNTERSADDTLAVVPEDLEMLGNQEPACN